MSDERTLAANREAVRRYRQTHLDRVLATNRAARRKYVRTENGAIRVAAHHTVEYAVRTGRLARLPCAVCEDPKSQGHHHNGYDDPLDVVWLCALHHKEAHRVAQ